MMTICHSKDSPQGEHVWQWLATGDGGGYWLCALSECGAVDVEGTGHHGG